MTQTSDARQAAVHQQFDLAATTMATVQSPEVVHDWTLVTASTMILVAKDCSASIQMCCRQHLYHCLLSSDAVMPSSEEEHRQSNLSHHRTILTHITSK